MLHLAEGFIDAILSKVYLLLNSCREHLKIFLLKRRDVCLGTREYQIIKNCKCVALLLLLKSFKNERCTYCDKDALLIVCLLKPSPPRHENKSDGRTETIDSIIFKSSQSNFWYKKMKSQLARGLPDFGVKFKPLVLRALLQV